MQIVLRCARILAVLTAVALAACGGSPQEGDGLTPTQREDRDASASSAGLLSFARSQIATSTSETAEPRPIDGIVPQPDDSAEPFTL
jgi:hypothetical protein